MLNLLLNDHNNIRKILTTLQRKIDAIINGQEVNYELLRTIIDYLQNNVEKSHHFVEEHIYAYCLEKEIQGNGIFAELASEHQQLENINEELAHMVDDILNDTVIPLEDLRAVLEHFVALQNDHMAKEENQLKPILQNNLSEDDWQQIQSQVQIDASQDPLFGQQISKQYLDLAEHLTKQDNE